jgi:hypothetical protein
VCYRTERTWESGRRDEEAIGEIRRLFDRYRAYARRSPVVVAEEDPPLDDVDEPVREELPAEPVLR